MLFAFQILPRALQSIMIVLVFISFLLKPKNDFSRVNLFLWIMVVLWYFGEFFTLAYSTNLKDGFDVLIRQLAIPVCFLIGITNKQNLGFKTVKQLLLTFVFSNFLYVIYIYGKVLYVAEITCYPEIYFMDFLDKAKFIIDKPNHVLFACLEFESNTSFLTHRVYNSMQFLFSVFIIAELVLNNEKWKVHNAIKFILIFIGILFIVTILYQFSVINVFLLFFLFPIFILYNLKSKIKRLIFTITIVLGIAFGVIFKSYTDLESAKNQLNVAINYFEDTFLNKEMKRSTNIDDRYFINKSSKIIFLDNYFLGVGIGDVQDKLNINYATHLNDDNYFRILEKKLNTHNNYYFFLLAGGILLFIQFLLSQGLIFKQFFQRKNALAISFMIVFLINLITENMLNRINGVLFYSVFIFLFFGDAVHKKA